MLPLYDVRYHLRTRPKAMRNLIYKGRVCERLLAKRQDPCQPHPLKADGGARRDRTDDLKLAKLALSQLSYGPEPFKSLKLPAGARHLKWWAWEDSNFRPHAYQARALTN